MQLILQEVETRTLFTVLITGVQYVSCHDWHRINQCNWYETASVRNRFSAVGRRPTDDSARTFSVFIIYSRRRVITCS